MKLLVTTEGNIMHISDDFQFGAWEPRDLLNGKVVHKWKVVKNGNTEHYIVDTNKDAKTGESEPSLQVFEINELPTDFTASKYLYVDGAFVANPDYAEPPLPTVERLDYAEENIDNLEEYSADLLYQVCLLQLGLTEEDI